MKKTFLLTFGILVPLFSNSFDASTVNIRKLENTDGENYKQITVALLTCNPEMCIRSIQEQEQSLNRQCKKFSISKYETIYGAFLEDTIIGIVGGGVPQPDCCEQKHIVEICILFVLPKYRNQGIGTRLLESFIEDVKTKGITRIVFPFINVNSYSLQKVLAKMNFEQGVSFSKWIKEQDGTWCDRSLFRCDVSTR